MSKSKGNVMLERARQHESKSGGLKTPQSGKLIKTATQDAEAYGPYAKGKK